MGRLAIEETSGPWGDPDFQARVQARDALTDSSTGRGVPSHLRVGPGAEYSEAKVAGRSVPLLTAAASSRALFVPVLPVDADGYQSMQFASERLASISNAVVDLSDDTSLNHVLLRPR